MWKIKSCPPLFHLVQASFGFQFMLMFCGFLLTQTWARADLVLHAKEATGSMQPQQIIIPDVPVVIHFSSPPTFPCMQVLFPAVGRSWDVNNMWHAACLLCTPLISLGKLEHCQKSNCVFVLTTGREWTTALLHIEPQ